MAAIQAEELPAFPSGKGSGLVLPRGASRRAALGDIPFLRWLYWSFRMEEVASVPWPTGLKHSFLDQQFNLQHRHYVVRFPRADFLILESRGEPIGRLYIDRDAATWHLVDIGFLPEWRGRGRGRATIEAIQRKAQASAASGIVLHVERRNTRAQSLYCRLHFHEVERGDTHIRMQWATT